MRPLRVTLAVIGVFQLTLGLLFLLAPEGAATLFGLEPEAPAWARWLLAMMAARFLGYAYGMFLAAREPEASKGWIDSMIAVQVIDWIATLAYLAAGALTFAQVTTAAFMPVVFVLALIHWHPRRVSRSRLEAG